MNSPNYATFYDPPILPTAYVKSYRHERRASAPVRSPPIASPEDRYTRLPPPPRRVTEFPAMPQLERINSAPGTDAERGEVEHLQVLRQRMADLEARSVSPKTLCAAVSIVFAVGMVCMVSALAAIKSNRSGPMV